MPVIDYAQQYERKTDEELLQLALEADQLTPEAHFALQSALAQRGINQSERLTALRQEEARDPGKFWMFKGFGRERYGKRDYSREGDIERFKTTVFIVLFWLPLIPITTFLLERNRETDRMVVLERLPLDWEQVLTVWVVAAAILLALVWAMKIYTR